ncbi:tRNA lysidine(34) synthetase TilS [Flavobacterium sp.]|uniref:tRNA lysidine(34) synthetase TilS n=1 Tax=Flavobacterium sp. TaxID=239 RepID=UPI0039E6A6E5
MLSDFTAHLNQNWSFLQGKKLLLAVSGGIDSMVMVDMFRKLSYDMGLAHCNFQLRGEESTAEQRFVQSFATHHGIPVFTTAFETQQFAEDFKLSVQQAARELRYRWFGELLEREHYDFLLTAHQADDNLETFLINLSRGTGIEGLTGIPRQNGKIIRPLLDFSREAIEMYAKANQLEWREDSSNASDKYLRNKIRHELVPVLKALNPQFLAVFGKTQGHLQQTQTMAEDAAILVYQQVAQQANGEIHFNTAKLKKLPNYRSYLYQWLREYGFTAWDDVYGLAESQSGKQILAPQYRLIRNRDFLILSRQREQNEPEIFHIEQGQKEVNFPIKMSFCAVDHLSGEKNNVIFVDAEKLQFPLVLRRWEQGDVFQPFGMNGQSKKVGKFFKDEKLSLTQKEQTWLLCSGGEIVWMVGLRADERFKVQTTTNQILKITVT